MEEEEGEKKDGLSLSLPYSYLSVRLCLAVRFVNLCPPPRLSVEHLPLAPLSALTLVGASYSYLTT